MFLDPCPPPRLYPSGATANTSASAKDHHQVEHFFDWGQSTELNYSQKQQHPMNPPFTGRFASIRSSLDYSYHSVYTESRQLLQDAILDSLLNQHSNVSRQNNNMSQQQEKQWIVFTAGCMGVGKTHTLQVLDRLGYFPLSRFLQVDPDEIRYRLPEYKFYAPPVAGEHTQKEAGYIAELLVHAALERGWNVLVDGSLRNAEWYVAHFQALRQQYYTDTRCLSLAIFHVTAPTELIYQRIHHRAANVGMPPPHPSASHQEQQRQDSSSGRIVPLSLLKQVLDQMPQAIQKLKACVDFYAELHNNGQQHTIQLSTPGLTWTTFQQQWQHQATSQ